jgi:predicted esterase
LTSDSHRNQPLLRLGAPLNKAEGVMITCLACEFVARHPRRYAGLISYRGGLIGPPDSAVIYPGCLSGTPAFLGSGDPDQYVPWQRVQRSAEVLTLMGADVTTRRYPGMSQTISPAEIEAARQHIGVTLTQQPR